MFYAGNWIELSWLICKPGEQLPLSRNFDLQRLRFDLFKSTQIHPTITHKVDRVLAELGNWDSLSMDEFNAQKMKRKAILSLFTVKASLQKLIRLSYLHSSTPFFKMSCIAREASKKYTKKAVAMSNTHPKLFPLYKFGAQLFELYQMIGERKITKQTHFQDSSMAFATGCYIRRSN